MKQKNYQRWSRWLLLTLFTLLVGVSPAWGQAKELPYSYGFENNNLASEGWTMVDCTTGYNSTRITSDAKMNGSYGFMFWYNNNPPQYLISPELATSTKTIDLSFWYINGNSYTEKFNVGYSLSNSETGSFTWLEDEDITAPTTWTQYQKTLPAGTKFVAIKYTSSNQYKLYIDDFSVEEHSTCIKPTGLTVSNITSSQAELSWTSDADNWNVQYKKTGDAGWTDVEGAISTKPYTLEGLTPAKNYQVRVRTYCSLEDQSGWTEPVAFTTDCATITSFPFTENFNDLASGIPVCWDNSDGNTGTASYNWNFFATGHTGACVRFNSYNTSSGKYNSLKTPAMNFPLGKTMQLSFWWMNPAGGDFSVYISNDGGSTYTTSLKTGLTGQSSWKQEEIVLPAGFSENVVIVFKATSNCGYGDAYIYLDDVTIEEAPACPKPTGLTASNPTSQGATLSWTAGSDETEWKIIYGAADFDPASEGTTIDNVTENPYTLTGLTPETTYDVYVKAVKGNDESVVSEKAAFTTLSAVPVIGLSATSHNFGMVSDADAQALTLTISNTGGAALTGLTVTPTSGFAVTDMEGKALTATTIAASSTLSVKVKMSALGQQNGTIAIDGNEIDAQVVNVSGYMLDDSKITETFTSASSVSRWTVASGWTFNASTGAYSGTSARTMTTPKISVGAGNVLALNVKLGWSGGSFTIEGSTDNGTTWDAFEAKTYNSSNGGLNTSSYVLLTINDIPTTVNKIRLTGYYAYINVFNGFTYVNDPQVGFFSNEACTSAQASPATKNFGFATEAQNQTYYVKNTGNGQVDLTIDAPSGFTATVNDGGEALTENEVATLTITMPATEGLHDGTITVTAKNHDDESVLGTFLVNANGGITGTKNNVVLTAFPAGWKNNNWAINSGAARIWSSTPSDLITTTLRVTAGDKLLIDAKKYYDTDDSQLSYSYSANNGTSWSDPVSLTNSLGTDYKIIAISDIPAGDVLMKFTGTYAYIRQIYGFEAVAEPIMEFAADGTTKNFGMITAKATSDAYTITNSGTALLDDLSVTCDNANFEIAVADNATSIAAGNNVTFTVALKTTALGSQSGTVTIAGNGVESKTLNVKGYVADNTKIFTTFTAQPDRWTNSSWTFDANGATAGYSNIATLTSPKIVASTQTLAISAKLQGNSNSYYVKVEGYDTANSDWTYSTTLSNDVLNSTSFTVVELNDIPTTVNRIRLVGKYVIVNALNGFTYDENDPEFSLFSDEKCNTPIATTTVTNAWGFVNEDKTATYYIKNTGTGTLNLSKTDAPTGFTATLGATSLTAGAKTSLTISMVNNPATNEGYHAGDVVLTAKDNAENTLGTFTVTSSGVVVGASKTDVNFTTLSAFPAGWEADGWSVTANTKATTSSSSKMLTTGTYTVASGEKLVIEGRGNSSWSSPSLTYRYSTDGGSSWTAGTSTLSYTYSASDYKLQIIDDIPAGNAKIEFTGSYMDIRRIYGYTAMSEPVMTLSPAATNHDFGMQTAAANYEITVTNSGTAEMTNLAAALTGADAAGYQVVMSIPDGSSATISENVATIPVGQTLKVTATLKASIEYKEHNATLTISADGLADKVITLTGKTRDASKLYADFQDDLPATWIADGWSRTYSGTNYFVQANASGTNTLTTPALTVAAGEELKYDAWFGYSAGSITVRYTTNNGITWTEQNVECSTTQTTKTLSLGNASPVTAYIQFVGNSYARIDNFYGGSPAVDVPLISVTKSGNAVESGDTEAFGSISEQATATYTITNVGNGTLTITSPVTTTGVATATVNATSLTNGQSATLTITMPVEAPYGEKSGAVTVKTNLGNFVINYNATILNPNALDEQFASGKPTGWYFGGYWEVDDQTAQNSASGVADLITEQLTVAGPSDELTFKAAKTGSSAETFRVYTSQDRVTWVAVDLGELTLTTSYQDVNISGLAAGDYYVKITGARVKVDNFLGWTKKNNTRDLYVTATSFPATTTKGNEATITATVTSLIAAETGVYAKLFVNGEEALRAEAQAIDLNAEKTFTFNYTMPAAAGNYSAYMKVYYSDDNVAFTTATETLKVYYEFDEDVNPGTIVVADANDKYDVMLKHTLVSGWNTICLPFAVAAEDITTLFGASATVYKFNGANGNNLDFGAATSMEAGTPYLIHVNAAKTINELVSGVELDTEANTVAGKFVGTYKPVAAGGLKDKYGVTPSNTIAKGNANTTMKGFRAYFEGISANARISIYDEATGISRVYAPADIFGDNDRVYNLSGQKVENAKKGVYIVNGRKVVVK